MFSGKGPRMFRLLLLGMFAVLFMDEGKLWRGTHEWVVRECMEWEKGVSTLGFWGCCEII